MKKPTSTSVEWIDFDAQEATVVVSDGEHTIQCFAHPYTGRLGEPVSLPLLTLGVEDVVRVSEPEGRVRQVDGFAHELLAIVTDTEVPLVRVGEIVIELDAPLPGDVRPGDVVRCFVERVDVVG